MPLEYKDLYKLTVLSTELGKPLYVIGTTTNA